jgi:hypothetical protein
MWSITYQSAAAAAATATAATAGFAVDSKQEMSHVSDDKLTRLLYRQRNYFSANVSIPLHIS